MNDKELQIIEETLIADYLFYHEDATLAEAQLYAEEQLYTLCKECGSCNG